LIPMSSRHATQSKAGGNRFQENNPCLTWNSTYVLRTPDTQHATVQTCDGAAALMTVTTPMRLVRPLVRLCTGLAHVVGEGGPAPRDCG
jgi:hypothetical protein